MTKDEALSISMERLGRWAGRLADVTATPAVLVGIRHDEGHAGELTVVVTEDMPDEASAAMLEKVAAAMKAARVDWRRRA